MESGRRVIGVRTVWGAVKPWGQVSVLLVLLHTSVADPMVSPPQAFSMMATEVVGSDARVQWLVRGSQHGGDGHRLS